MANIMFITVGTGRTGEDIAQAIHFSIKHHNPEYVVFFCSETTREKTLPYVHKLLNWPREKYEVVVTADENNVQLLYNEYLNRIRQSSGQDVIVDFTSGTKAMSAALFAAGIAVEAGQVSYVTGPRDDTGRAIKSESILSFPPEQVIAERQLARAAELFNIEDYHAAWNLAKQYQDLLARDTYLGRLAHTLYLLGMAYDYWDHFRWRDAAYTLNKLINPRENAIGLDTAQLKANAGFCNLVHREKYGPQRIVDLYNNASRRLKQGRFDDALARLYRAYEFLVQCRLKNEYELETGEITLEALQNKDLSAASMERYKKRAANSQGFFKLALYDAMELLAEMGDKLGLRLINLYWRPGHWAPNKKMNDRKDTGDLKNWLNQRNRSWMAHGTNPAKEKFVTPMLEEYKKLLTEFVPDFDELLADSRAIKYRLCSDCVPLA